MNRQSNTLGILYLIAGISIFSVQDLILKLISGGYPLYEAMIIRGLTSVPLLLIVAHLDGGIRSLFTKGLVKMLLRGVVLFVTYFSFYIALAGLPLPTTVALYYSGPLFITLLSVFFLGERVGLVAWIAVIAGFVGVIIMVRPGTALFNWAALLPVLSGLTYSIAMIAARKMGGVETAAALAFWGNAVFLLAAGLLGLYFGTGNHVITSHPSLVFLTMGWVTPSPFDIMLMMLCGVIAAFGLGLLTQAYRIAAASKVAPFEYTGLIWSLLWGWIFWRDWPDFQGWIGIAIIAGAGICILLREKMQTPERAE